MQACIMYKESSLFKCMIHFTFIEIYRIVMHIMFIMLDKISE